MCGNVLERCSVRKAADEKIISYVLFVAAKFEVILSISRRNTVQCRLSALMPTNMLIANTGVV